MKEDRRDMWHEWGLIRMPGRLPLGNLEKGLLERPECMREVNIEMDMKRMQSEGMDWVNVAQDVDTCRSFGLMSLKTWTRVGLLG